MPGWRAQRALSSRRSPAPKAAAAARRTRAEAILRALVHGPIADNYVCHAAVHGHRRLVHRGAGAASTVVDATEEPELFASKVAEDLDLGVVVHGGGRSVHIARCKAHIIEGRLDRFHGKLQLASAGVLRELRGADTDDGGLIFQSIVMRTCFPGSIRAVRARSP